jgi:hypothetical protein
VRTCDGYYFPISPRASQSRFKRDARMCQRMCGADAKLYYTDRDSTDMSQLQGVDGQPYSKLPQAFAYRKSLIEGCSCKPMPWDEAEKSRHTMYAIADQIAKSQRETFERSLAAKAAASSGKPPPDEKTTDAKTVTTLVMKDAEPERKIHVLPGQSLEVVEDRPQPRSTMIQTSATLVQARNRMKQRSNRRSFKFRRTETASVTARSVVSNAAQTYTWPGDAPPRKR